MSTGARGGLLLVVAAVSFSAGLFVGQEDPTSAPQMELASAGVLRHTVHQPTSRLGPADRAATSASRTSTPPKPPGSLTKTAQPKSRAAPLKASQLLALVRRSFVADDEALEPLVLESLKAAKAAELDELVLELQTFLDDPMQRNLGLSLLRFLAQVTHPRVGAFFARTFHAHLSKELMSLYAWALENNPAPEKIGALRTAYMSNYRQNPFEGALLLTAMAATKLPEVWPLLQSEYSNNRRIQTSALMAIAQHGAAENRAFLELVADLEKPAVFLNVVHRRIAIHAIASIGDSASLAFLRNVQQQATTAEIRRACEVAITSILIRAR